MNVCMYVCMYVGIDLLDTTDRQRDIEMMSPEEEGGRYGMYGVVG